MSQEIYMKTSPGELKRNGQMGQKNDTSARDKGKIRRTELKIKG